MAIFFQSVEKIIRFLLLKNKQTNKQKTTTLLHGKNTLQMYPIYTFNAFLDEVHSWERSIIARIKDNKDGVYNGYTFPKRREIYSFVIPTKK